MNEINILVLSAGRRVELIQEFKKASEKLNIKSTIVAADCSETAPAIYFADKNYRLPLITDSSYISSIIDICKKENITLVVPTIDTDLLLLSENKEYIEDVTNAKVMISDISVIEICRDKISTQKFLEYNGFGTAKMYTKQELDNENIRFPLFIKPANGSSSINAFKVNNREELSTYRELIDDPIVQDFMDGDEYTVDVFLDFESNLITVVPRLRMATRSGEISKGKIIKDQEIIKDVSKLMNRLKPIGHMTVQLMKTTKGIKYIEINPRFGGGAPMSIQSGANSCENLYKILNGHKISYNEEYRDDIVFLRYDSSICLDENMNVINEGFFNKSAELLK